MRRARKTKLPRKQQPVENFQRTENVENIQDEKEYIEVKDLIKMMEGTESEAAVPQEDENITIFERENNDEDSIQNEEVQQAEEAQQPEETQPLNEEQAVQPEQKEQEELTGNAAQEQAHTKVKKNFNPKYLIIFVISFLVAVIFSFVVIIFGGKTRLFQTDKNAENMLVPIDVATGKVNVLIMGVDKDGLRTDTIIVASLDTDDRTLNFLSIPRDTRMYVGSKYQKINAAHAITNSNGEPKGAAGTIEAVGRLTQIPINYYVEFDFDTFKETINALGGVDFTVPQDMFYEDPYQDLYIDLKEGYQKLDGSKAEQLVRFRQYPEGDIKRVQVQQEFIQAVIAQKANAAMISKIPELYAALSRNIKSNLVLQDLLSYANAILQVDAQNIVMHSLPGTYSEESQYAASYWLCDIEETKKLIEDVFGYDASEATIGKDGEAPMTIGKPSKTTTPTKTPTTKDDDDDEPKKTQKPQTTKKPIDEDDEDLRKTEKPTSKATKTPKTTSKATPKPSSKPTSEPTTEPTKTPKATSKITPKPTSEPESTPKTTPKPTDEAKKNDKNIITIPENKKGNND